eukprot:gene7917-1129_t
MVGPSLWGKDLGRRQASWGNWAGQSLGADMGRAKPFGQWGGADMGGAALGNGRRQAFGAMGGHGHGAGKAFGAIGLVKEIGAGHLSSNGGG